jgi:PIN domain nuclease of toxin-antitoxin system
MTLLDTHSLIWATADPAKLSRAATEAIRKASQEGGVAIAAITLWELAWLASHQRLQITGTVEAYLAEITARVAIRPITPQIAALANQFPANYPSDPCDRLIGATALAEAIPLVTKDANIRRSLQINTVW